MKVQKTELAAKLNKIKGVVPKKDTKAVLQGVLYKEGYLTANNLEMAVKVKLGGIGDGCFIIPERAFDLINNLPDGEVDISVTGKNTITIKEGKIKNKYQTFDPVQFPDTVAPEDDSQLTVKAGVLLESIKRVSYAVSPQGNSVMGAMCLQASGGELNFVGLDGHVLAWDRVGYEGEFELLIPKNTAEKLKSLGLSGDVQIRHSKTAAVFAAGDFEVYTRLIAGEYYKYQAMFKELPIHTSVSRIELVEAMTRAKMCTEEKSPVRFEMEGNSLSLSIKDSKTDYFEVVDLHEGVAEPLTIGFDARLVLETLKVFDCGSVGISFGGPKMPMIVEAEGSNFKAIVLPVVI